MTGDLRYRCMPQARLETRSFAVSAVQPRHIEAIRRWRNAQLDVLRQAEPITEAQQQAYYASHVWPALDEERPANLLLVLEQAGEAVGYGGLVHIAWEHRRAEVSFLLDPRLAADETVYARHFTAFLALIKDLAFGDLGFNRLFVETYANRTHHISVLEAAGFVLEGVMRQHVFIDGRPVDSLVHGCLNQNPGMRSR